MLEIVASSEPFATKNNSLYLKLLEWNLAPKSLAVTLIEFEVPGSNWNPYVVSVTWKVFEFKWPLWNEISGIFT